MVPQNVDFLFGRFAADLATGALSCGKNAESGEPREERGENREERGETNVDMSLLAPPSSIAFRPWDSSRYKFPDFREMCHCFGRHEQ